MCWRQKYTNLMKNSQFYGLILISYNPTLGDRYVVSKSVGESVAGTSSMKS
jgi:hypothetical protein